LLLRLIYQGFLDKENTFSTFDHPRGPLLNIVKKTPLGEILVDDKEDVVEVEYEPLVDNNLQVRPNAESCAGQILRSLEHGGAEHKCIR